MNIFGTNPNGGVTNCVMDDELKFIFHPYRVKIDNNCRVKL